MASEIVIPKEAFQIGKAFKRDDIKEWFCPDCGAKGTQEDCDFITENRFNERESMVQYCCGECFEENIYITIEPE